MTGVSNAERWTSDWASQAPKERIYVTDDEASPLRVASLRRLLVPVISASVAPSRLYLSLRSSCVSKYLPIR